MDTIKYKPKGVCSQMMEFQVEDGKIVNAKVMGGCNGNLNGICSIIKDMDIDRVIERFEGVRCGFKPTSCPDQIACALKQYRESK